MTREEVDRICAINNRLWNIAAYGKLAPEDELTIRDARDLIDRDLRRISDLESELRDTRTLILPSQRFEAARAAMQGLVAGVRLTPVMAINVGEIVGNAIALGDALVEQLQVRS